MRSKAGTYASATHSTTLLRGSYCSTQLIDIAEKGINILLSMISSAILREDLEAEQGGRHQSAEDDKWTAHAHRLTFRLPFQELEENETRGALWHSDIVAGAFTSIRQGAPGSSCP